jgi:hypothetical protein
MVRIHMSDYDYHTPEHVEEPPPKIPDKKLSHVRYLVGRLDNPSKFVPVTVCFLLRYTSALELIARLRLQKSQYWKNQMSRRSILYTVQHLGLDLSQDVLFLPS